MTLVSNPHHVVEIYPARSVLKPDGMYAVEYLQKPLVVRCNFQPIASDNLSRTSSVREEYYGTKLSTTGALTSPPGTFDKLRESLPPEYQDEFPVNAVVVYTPGKYTRQAGLKPQPTSSKPYYYTINAREVVFRMGVRTQHDKVAITRGNDRELSGVPIERRN